MKANINTQIRVLVVDDNLIARLGIVSLLEALPGVRVVAQADDGHVAITRYRELRPDVVLCDMRMPVFDGAQTAAALQRETPPGKVLVLSHFESDEDIHRARAAGALGYVTKDVRGDELLRALHAVATGQPYLPKAIQQRLDRREQSRLPSLREREVLQLVFLGCTNKVIAKEMNLALKTVEMHISSVLVKLGAESRTDAVRLALERGLLSPDDAKKRR